VVSDTHGNVEGLRQAVREIRSRHNVDLFIHLGDDYDDAQVFDELGCAYLRIPGVYSDYYADSSVPNRLVKPFEGWRFLLSHTDRSHSNDLTDDLKPEELIEAKQIDVVLYGHSHIPRLHSEKGILFINPGHLKSQDKKGYPASYAIITIDRERVKASILGLGSHKVLKQSYFKKVKDSQGAR
jgi:putative phosphoesterase